MDQETKTEETPQFTPEDLASLVQTKYGHGRRGRKAFADYAARQFKDVSLADLDRAWTAATQQLVQEVDR